jgi:hypothetical protein
MVRAMKLLSLMIFVMLSLAACKKDPAPTAPPPGNNGGEPVAADPYACTVDDDCVAVELQCCDACNGGRAVGVHEDHVDAVVADSPRGRGECGDVMCTKMGCAPWIASCEDGTCAIVRGTLE